MLPTHTIYQIALSRITGMNTTLANLLIESAGGIEQVFGAEWNSFAKEAGINSQMLKRDHLTAALIEAEKEISFIERGGIVPLFYTDNNYPQRLLECADAPVMLYTKGDCNLNAKRIVSIVGTRHATHYGKEFCEEFVQDLSLKLPDTLIISGLAYGIDICAHRSALKNGLPTAAVMAHPLNTIYPASHRQTAVDIVRSGGSMITEYCTTDVVHKQNFVARNRIVAGMADATLVIESASKGGALITANIANSYGRELFALPGRVGDTYSAGCNQLIAQNKAALLLSTEQFLSQMGWKSKSSKRIPKQRSLFDEQLSENEKLIVDILVKREECQIDILSMESGLPTSQLLPLLLELEFKGCVRTSPGGIYRPAK